MKISIKNIIVPSIPITILMIGSCFGLWFLGYFRDFNTHLLNINISDFKLIDFKFNTLSTNIINIVLVIINAILLIQLNNIYTLIRTRTFLTILIFLFLMCTWSETHLLIGSHLATTFFTFSLFYFFRMYRNTQASEQSFMGSFFIGLCSLIFNPLLVLLPICWIGFIMLQSFSLRTFLASLFGFIAPWILYFATKMYIHPEHLLALNDLNFHITIKPVIPSLPFLVYIIALCIILVICLFGMYSKFQSDAIHTRSKLNFLFLFLLAFLLIAITFNIPFIAYLPFIALLFSVLASYTFSLNQNNFYSIIFIIFFVLNTAIFIYKLFII